MGRQTPSIAAEHLESGMTIIDGEGNLARVNRYQWIDENRGRLSTDLGVRIVNHTDRFRRA